MSLPTTSRKYNVGVGDTEPIGGLALTCYIERKAGKPIHEIAEQTGLSEDTVTRYAAYASGWLKRYVPNREDLLKVHYSLVPIADKALRKKLEEGNAPLMKAFYEGIGLWSRDITFRAVLSSMSLSDLLGIVKGEIKNDSTIQDALKDVDWEEIPDNEDALTKTPPLAGPTRDDLDPSGMVDTTDIDHVTRETTAQMCTTQRDSLLDEYMGSDGSLTDELGGTSEGSAPDADCMGVYRAKGQYGTPAPQNFSHETSKPNRINPLSGRVMRPEKPKRRRGKPARRNRQWKPRLED